MDFTPSDSAFFVRVALPDAFGEEESFLRIRTMPIVVFEGEREFPVSLIEELGLSRILRSLYFNGLRNQRVKAGHSSALHSIRPKTVFSLIHQVEKGGTSFTDAPKFVLRQDSKSQNSTSFPIP
ncbi:hypothetical protein AVEN_171021-1 [Araneus ventricosus]|uniref:Uncharacterized protein n=1 Tax=Araneus ventricosus TaxID=182803 RepID=A0A4Y2Q8M8_ARAVE|nr:hypothetical protein AVEN_171021-1 [Araneus ventricosus]